MHLLLKFSHFDLFSWIFKWSASLKIANLHIIMQLKRINVPVIGYISPNQKYWSQMLSGHHQKSPNSQTKIFATKRLQNSTDFRNLLKNSPLWQPHLLQWHEVNTCRFVSILLLRNEVQKWNNMHVSVETCLCRQTTERTQVNCKLTLHNNQTWIKG